VAFDLTGKIRRGLKKPPRYIAERLWSEAVRLSDRWRAPARARRLTDVKLLEDLGHRTMDEAWTALQRRPFPTFASVRREDLDALAPGEVARIVDEASAALANRVDLMGSGPIELGSYIDWHCDAKTGRRWPPRYCHAIEYSNLDEPSDVKFPWELSRLQWLIPAGQAYALTGDEFYAAHVRSVLDSWIVANPYAGSVNWSCTMEAALRLFSITWLARACAQSAAFDDAAFRARLLRTLYLHADFTERYIERSDVNGNHYTADAAGLVIAGCVLGDGPLATRWRQTGWRILNEEIETQVFPDGVDFEASVPYHRLVMELFLLPAVAMRRQGHAVTPAYASRLGAMAEFVAAYSRPDGSVPVWGDTDDARALPMAGKGLSDHRYLVAMAAFAAERVDLLERFGGPVAEILWTFGADAARQCADRTGAIPASRAFEDGGFYILADTRNHVFVDCGPLGLAGRGGHGHNDLLSFEAMLDGVRLVVDPGCYLYTASAAERNAFRSTAYHNTPQVGGAEINRFIRPDYLWNMHCDAAHEVRRWSPGTVVSSIEMAHSGYRRLSPPVTPVRLLTLDHAACALVIDDRFEGGGHHACIPLHLAPGIVVKRADDAVIMLAAGARVFKLRWTGTGDWSMAIEPARVAPSYGIVVPTQKLVWRIADCGGTRLSVTLEPVR
jgi:uncharacterized heparinase superfamily protein